jgi:hypothetical protein
VTSHRGPDAVRSDHQRITIVIETPDMPSNDVVAASALVEVVRHLQRGGVYPTAIRLELAPAPTTCALATHNLACPS